MYHNFQGNQTYYEICGEGNPILFLHGWGGEISSFLPTIDYFKNTNKCIAIDLLGFGKSDKIKRSFNVSDYADCVLEILEKEGINSLSIIAHSFGCRVAFKIMSKNSGLVKSAVLVAPAGLKDRSIKTFFKIRLFKLQKFLHKKKIIKSDLFYKKSGSADYKALSPVMQRTFIKVVNEDLKKDVKRIKSPVLLIAGRGDEAVAVSKVKKIKKLVKTADYACLLGGHFCYLKENQRFNLLSERFICAFSND
ncbi:MAG: alpha/beta hydrolase [Clostridia bacterium]|nr:alpha/beta hydrolase [Clostridia bacterium]